MDEDDVTLRFDSVHDITEEQVDQIEDVRAAYKELALLIVGSSPHSRTRAIAISKLEDSSHFAIKAISHRV